METSVDYVDLNIDNGVTAEGAIQENLGKARRKVGEFLTDLGKTISK